MRRVVLFDMDGVLVDSLQAHLKICEDLSKRFHLRLTIPSPQEFRSLAQRGKPISPMKTFFAAVGFPKERLDEADAYYQEHFATNYRPTVFDGVPAMLERLHNKGMVLGLATSNVRANVEAALGSSWKYFSPHFCFTFDDEPQLDKAEALRRTAQELGIEPEEILYVGDQPSDYRAASKAGADFLGVTYGWAIAEGEADFPTVDSPRAVGDYLLETNEEFLKMALEHGQSMFVYHAGQRHGSLNFYFAVLGAFVAGVVSVLSSDKLWSPPGLVAPLLVTLVGFGGVAATFFFWRLDKRNEDLVEWDGELLSSAEREFKKTNRSIPRLTIMENSKKAPPGRLRHDPKTGDAKHYERFKYRWIVPRILLVFVSIFGLAIAGAWIRYAAELMQPASHVVH